MYSVNLKNVCLDYVIQTGSKSIKQSFIQSLKKCIRKKNAPTNQLFNTSYRALHDINLSLKSGDALGLLGRNGAGKSSLLRVLARIYTPNIGTAAISGKIANIFDIDLGMNPEATGYENIINLVVMRGGTTKYAQSLVPDVEAFTELGNFLHQPVRTYSSGMQLKLSFAVATAMPSEILLIDETIGVGDAHFMKKAEDRMHNMIKNSQVLVLTSHSNDIIRKFCNKVLVLEQGHVRYLGDVESGIAFYDGLL